MNTQSHDEIERTYDVGPDESLPPLLDLPGVARVAPPVEHRLTAVYVDTEGLDLARSGVTLRRRTGGTDAGWHLKLARRGDTRTEVHLPPGRSAAAVPPALLEPVRAAVRDRPIRPVATIATRRVEHTLLGEDGQVLATVCDDHVEAQRRGDGQATAWREWEVELGVAPRELLAVVERLLLDVGAAPAPSGSKLARVLGIGRAQRQDDDEDDSLGGAVRQHLDRQRRRLHVQDARLRAGKGSAVHKMRIAVRRTRSALSTYRDAFEPSSAKALADELRWLGQELSPARDAEVLREHLDSVLAAEPPELVLGGVVAFIDDELRTALVCGREQALVALCSERYYRLLDAFDAFVDAPPFAPAAARPSCRALPDVVRGDARRLRRCLRAVRRAPGPRERDLALHDARKKAKRLRYAAESAQPVLGRRARRLGKAVASVQEVLGRHHDSVVARELLQDMGVRAQLAGQNAFTFGRLHALEQARAQAAERDLEPVWRTVRHAALLRR